jgi:deoxyribodipyrimidine photo-lyase
LVQVVWFKRDLRTLDHRPLAEAAAAGPLIPIYIVEPAYWALPDTSWRQWQAIRSALMELAERLAELGAPLVVRAGPVTEVLARIHRTVGITRLLAHEETGNAWTYARDRAVRAFCRQAGVAFVEYPAFGVTVGPACTRRFCASPWCRSRNGWWRRCRALAAGDVLTRGSIRTVAMRCNRPAGPRLCGC